MEYLPRCLIYYGSVKYVNFPCCMKETRVMLSSNYSLTGKGYEADPQGTGSARAT